MHNVEEILQLESLMRDLETRRDAAKNRPAEWDTLNTAINAADQERLELMANLSPEDQQWLEVEQACERHGVNEDVQ